MTGALKKDKDKEVRSPMDDIPWLSLVGRCIIANSMRRGISLDRREIRAIIDKNDELNRQIVK